MAIKAGDLVTTAPGSSPTMISDGKRMRVLWTNDHGDGDSTKSLATRSKTTVRGHPTWKLYAGDVPIYHGKSEPPRYVYLDDRACYTIFSSRAYGEKDLNTFWPYAFDNLGNIKASRSNRGRPAYLDTACTVYAKGSLRGRKEQCYEFCGEPVSSGQHTSQWRVKKEAERAYAMKIQAGAQISLSGAFPVTSSPSTKERTITPRGYPIGNTSTIYPARPVWKEEVPIGNARIKYKNFTPRHYSPGPINGDLKPLGMTENAVQGSPYLHDPAAAIRKRPRYMSGDMAAAYAGFNSKRNTEEAFPTAGPAVTETTTEQKRIKFEQNEGDLDENMTVAEKLNVSE